MGNTKTKNKKLSAGSVIIHFIKSFMEYDLPNLACQISFRFLLGIFPFLLFLITMLSKVDIDISVLAQHAEALPDFTVQMLSLLITDLTTNTAPMALISTTFIFSIYSSANAFKTIIEALNKIYYGRIEMSLVRRYIYSVLFVVLFFFLVILPLVYYVFSSAIWAFINTFFNISISNLSATDSILLFCCMFAYLTGLVMLIYGMSLGKKVNIKSTFPGAFTCVFAWWLSSYGFNFYVSHFSNYSKIYGSLGTIILFLLWIYFITLVLMVGALINKLIYDYRNN